MDMASAKLADCRFGFGFGFGEGCQLENPAPMLVPVLVVQGQYWLAPEDVSLESRILCHFEMLMPQNNQLTPHLSRFTPATVHPSHPTTHNPTGTSNNCV